MNFEKLNGWLTLGANIGVLLGLIILIVEVRQNAALTRTELEINANNALSQIEYNLATPHGTAAWVKSVRAPSDMTDEEIRLVETHLVAVMQQWDTLFDMEEVGLVSRDRVRSHVRNTAPFYFGSAHARNWWRLQEPGWEDTAMYEVAGPVIEEIDPNFLARNLDASRVATRIETDENRPASVEAEARAFMAAYAVELREGNRRAVAARYHSEGAYMIIDGVGGRRTRGAIKELYEESWTPPLSFRWKDLSYERISTDAVAVVGQFEWGIPSGLAVYSYSGILRRDRGTLRIVLEDETRVTSE